MRTAYIAFEILGLCKPKAGVNAEKTKKRNKCLGRRKVRGQSQPDINKQKKMYRQI